MLRAARKAFASGQVVSAGVSDGSRMELWISSGNLSYVDGQEMTGQTTCAASTGPRPLLRPTLVRTTPPSGYLRWRLFKIARHRFVCLCAEPSTSSTVTPHDLSCWRK